MGGDYQRQKIVAREVVITHDLGVHYDGQPFTSAKRIKVLSVIPAGLHCAGKDGIFGVVVRKQR